ncbi:MAG TPA: hypothetical protein VKK79_22370 [Candidatus Lokiarchaeia archaeon]|nr:hypothetical protein [Candidatus Lokiarchaeia archaeon]
MVFNWLVTRVARWIGRSSSSLYYNLLYREIFNEILDLNDGDVKKSVVEFRKLGTETAAESAVRQDKFLRFFPSTPKTLFDYFQILWQVLFGMEMGEFEKEDTFDEESGEGQIIFKIKQCPICGGIGGQPEGSDVETGFNAEVRKFPKNDDAYACGFVGMLMEVANHIYRSKGAPCRAKLVETKCMARGDSCLELTITFLPAEEFDTAEQAAEVKPQSPLDRFLALDKVEEFFSAPLEKVRKSLDKVINEQLDMDPTEFFSHFENYEDDMLRIIGYLGVHLVNELGGIVEKAFSNSTLAKLGGYIFNMVSQLVDLFVPREILDDYKQLVIELLTGLAPETMVLRLREFEGHEMVALILEGVKKALINLGVNFEELKGNIWEEFRSSMSDMPEEERKNLQVELIQEIMMLLTSFMAIPNRMLLSAAHAQVKTLATSGEDILSSVREHGEKIFDIVDRIRERREDQD